MGRNNSRELEAVYNPAIKKRGVLPAQGKVWKEKTGATADPVVAKVRKGIADH